MARWHRIGRFDSGTLNTAFRDSYSAQYDVLSSKIYFNRRTSTASTCSETNVDDLELSVLPTSTRHSLQSLPTSGQSEIVTISPKRKTASYSKAAELKSKQMCTFDPDYYREKEN